ncbi:MAG: hypothetical protein AB1453_01940 [Chloroflexota bacterium]
MIIGTGVRGGGEIAALADARSQGWAGAAGEVRQAHPPLAGMR